MVVALLILALWFGVGFSGDIVFVVREDVDVKKLSKEDIRKIFLKERNFLDGTPALPVNLSPDDPIRKKVEEKVLDMDREELNLLWNEKYIHGVEPPPTFGSQKAVKEVVKRIKGAVGYIEEGELEEGLKVIYRLRDEDN